MARGEKGEIKGRMFGGLTSLRKGYLPSLDSHPLPKKGNKMGWKEKGGGENGRLSRGRWEQQASGPGIVLLVILGFPQLRQEVDQAG